MRTVPAGEANLQPSASSSQALSVPSHVPPALVVDFDAFQLPGQTEDPHLRFHELRQAHDFFYTARNKGHWVFTQSSDIHEVLRNTDLFSSYPAYLQIPEIERPKQKPLELDPPEHLKWRKVLAPIFSPRALEGMESSITALMDELIDGVIDSGSCEFVDDIASRLPIETFLKWMGLPSDRRVEFLSWVKMKNLSTDAKGAEEGMAKAIDYLRGVLRERQENPRDDTMSRLLRQTYDGEPIPLEEFVGVCTSVFFAGLNTVTNQMSFFAAFLAKSPEHRRQLASNPDLIPKAVEELMRRYGLPNMIRSAKSDFVHRGVTIRAGDRIMVPLHLIGMDEQQNADPFEVDFRRTTLRHTNFGSGPHKCPGSHLARLELRIFLERWIDRIPEFELAPNAMVGAYCGSNSLGVSHLYLVWETSRSEH
jgi:cytochrome P450